MTLEELREKVVSTKTVYEGKIIKLRVDTVTLPNGNKSEREIIEHPGGVGIIPVTKDKKVYMVRQYRHPYEVISLEIPAGKLDFGEDHFECGKRELREETGFSADKYTYLGEFHPTPGFCDERLHIYLAEGLHKGEQDTDEDEFINVEEYSLDELVQMIKDGKVHDCKTTIAILLAKQMLG